MSTVALEPADPAVPFDTPLRFHVRSRSRAHDTYLIDLADYKGNGTCQCSDFQMRLEPLLRRGITAAQALEAKMVRLSNSKGDTKEPEDALRCWHIIHARRQFTDDAIAALAHLERDRTVHPDDPPPF